MTDGKDTADLEARIREAQRTINARLERRQQRARDRMRPENAPGFNFTKHARQGQRNKRSA